MIPSDLVDAHSQKPSKYSEWVNNWKRFKGYITTHAQPWKVDDPKSLEREKKLWKSLSDLIESRRSELSHLIEISTDPIGSFDILGEAHAIPPAVVEVSNRAAALELKYRGGQAAAAPSSRGAAAVPYNFDSVLPWQGSAEAQPIYTILVNFNYRLPTAIAAVAPRFGAELPALARILIEHKHLPGPPQPEAAAMPHKSVAHHATPRRGAKQGREAPRPAPPRPTSANRTRLLPAGGKPEPLS